MGGQLILALLLIQFTGPTGARIDVNADHVNSIRDPQAMPKGHWTKNVHCIITMDNNKLIAIMESCDEARQALKAKGGSGPPCTLVCGDASRR
jgi:hypothetical protein